MNEKMLKSWSEAEAAEDALNPYLRIKTGEEKVISVKEVHHVEKDLPVWEKGQMVEGKTERKVVTQLFLDKVDGKDSHKVFEVISRKLRETFHEYDLNLGLTRWTFKVKRLDKDYAVTPVAQKVTA